MVEACWACGGAASRVYHAAASIMRGWYCPHCGHFESAIGRERQLGISADVDAQQVGYSGTAITEGHQDANYQTLHGLRLPLPPVP